VPQRRRGVERARALVAESGVPTVELTTGITDPSWQVATQLVVAQLGEVGLDVQVRTAFPEAYFADVRRSATFHFGRTGTLPIPTGSPPASS
jgi:peptide/nickel transport system substrate-binding protein